ncbi:hypothetical protein M5K25_018419 [Dendrobium thyrsiflorum]|uniref:Uncharacterized protein n=1 Tax=Dendrobium thyrsiflorum TaxID=117978 RepID=A0ABD0UQ53_DENTH
MVTPSSSDPSNPWVSVSSDGKNRSFKDVLAGVVSSSLLKIQLVHTSSKCVPTLMFDEFITSKLAAPFAFTLVGKFLLRRPNLDVIQKKIYESEAFWFFFGGTLARVLVELDVSKKHPKEICLGSELNEYFQEVEFENLPIFCNHYKRQGHGVVECFILHPMLRQKKDDVSESRENKNANEFLPQEISVQVQECNLETITNSQMIEKGSEPVQLHVFGENDSTGQQISNEDSNPHTVVILEPSPSVVEKSKNLDNVKKNMDEQIVNISRDFNSLFIEENHVLNGDKLNELNEQECDVEEVIEEGEIFSDELHGRTQGVENIPSKSFDDFDTDGFPKKGGKGSGNSLKLLTNCILMINSIIWNIRGIGCPFSRLRVKILCRTHNVLFLVILEPLISVSKLNETTRYLGFMHNLANVSNKILLFWHDPVIIDMVGGFNQVLYCKVEYMQFNFFASLIYASSSHLVRRELWSQLYDFCVLINSPWFVGGDFNSISDPSKRGVPILSLKIWML